MSFEEAEILKERAQAFLRNAKRLFEEGEYDLSIFCLEQYCQLILKYKLLVKTGTYPRVHSLTRLLSLLSKVTDGRLASLMKKYLLHITKLEDAYIVSRYLPRRYSREEVEEILRFVEEVFKPVVEGV